MAASGNSNGRFIINSTHPVESTVTDTVFAEHFYAPISFSIDPHADIIACIQTEVNRLPQPNARRDLFEFCFRVRRILTRRRSTEFLVHPLAPNTPPLQRRLSRLCQQVLQGRLSDSFVQFTAWHEETYDFLQQLNDLTPDILDSSDVSPHYPERGCTEFLFDYLSRFELWQTRCLPDDSPCIVTFCALAIWQSQARFYKVESLANEFKGAVKSMTSLVQVYQWFKQHDEFIKPLDVPPTNAQGRPQAHPKSKPRNQGSPQNQGSTPRPLAADKDGGAQKQYYGKVSKQDNVMKCNKISRETLVVNIDKIQDLKSFGLIDVLHCKGDDNLADVLTKPLSDPTCMRAAKHWLLTYEQDT